MKRRVRHAHWSGKDEGTALHAGQAPQHQGAFENEQGTAEGGAAA